MLDDLQRLRESNGVYQLLSHYADLAEPDREAWQDRLMQMTGVEAKDLVKCHGELIAFGWIEQNTGQVPVLKEGVVPACYRITSAGRRALRESQAETEDAPDGDDGSGNQGRLAA